MGSMGHDNRSAFAEVWRDGKLVKIPRDEWEREQAEREKARREAPPCQSCGGETCQS